ncbi:SAM-dependent methyltransferase [Actinocrispum sp. NPDC049592]|uniref:SAM-dependent methyltransferase n=1 Tax=Actinocrispum sp. NPDC049592 TaxID=3154835 RepID=UPI0034156E66
MAGERNWIPDDVDINRPSVARVYDYALGGAHNLACDRAVFQQLLAIHPRVREMAWTNRAFLRRAVLYMMDQGIRQFLDLGSGIPTVGNVHEIAQRADPEARVVYVDREDIAVAHSRLLLERNPLATIVEADITRPDHVLRHPDAQRLLDFAQPVGLLAMTVGHYVPDDQVREVFRTYRDAVAPGSMLGITHLTNDFAVPTDEMIATASRAGGDGMYSRTKAEVAALFGDFELCPPGIVQPSGWHPDPVVPGGPRSEDDGFWSGVGVKRPVMTPERTVPD